MQSEFIANGVRYSIQMTPRSKRDCEATPEIKPDLTLWTSKQRRAVKLPGSLTTPKEPA
jgi:hypothetical protein